MTRALQVALIHGHSEIISLILGYDDRLHFIIDLERIIKLLNKIIANPNIKTETRDLYSALLKLLITRVHFALQLRREMEPSSEKTFQQLPSELIAILLSFLYAPPYKMPRG